MVPRAAQALTIAALLWTGILLAAPEAITHQTFAIPATGIYAASSAICHQRSERSFHLSGMQLPVCARCFGLYLSGAVGALVAWGFRPRLLDRARTILGLAAAPTALTWGAEVAGLAAFSNLARAMAALPLGLVAGWLFVQLLRYDSHVNGDEIHNGRPRAGIG